MACRGRPRRPASATGSAATITRPTFDFLLPLLATTPDQCTPNVFTGHNDQVGKKEALRLSPPGAWSESFTAGGGWQKPGLALRLSDKSFFSQIPNGCWGSS